MKLVSALALLFASAGLALGAASASARPAAAAIAAIGLPAAQPTRLGQGSAVAPPAAPAPYAVPRNAVRVSSSAGLREALAGSAPRNIVLADGVYDQPRPFLNGGGHKVYAAHLGKAVLKTGFVLGGNWGPGGAVLQGVSFDVSSTAKTNVGAIVNVWGKGQRSRVLDVSFDGNSAVGSALFVQQPEGFVGRRLVARRFTSGGVTIDTYPRRASFSERPVLEDVDVAAVSRSTPRSSNGTAESCLWIGVSAAVRRIKVRDCAWMGIWTGSYVLGATFEDLDVDRTPVGVYLEHFTTRSTFARFRIGSGVRTGFNCEWADPAWQGKPGSVDNVIEDGVIESSRAGVYMDEGTTRTVVRRVTFRGQSWAAVGDYKGIGNTYAANDYDGIDAGAVALTKRHISSARG